MCLQDNTSVNWFYITFLAVFLGKLDVVVIDYGMNSFYFLGT